MDFNINSRRLNPPHEINLSYPRDIRQLNVTWDMIPNPDKNISTGLFITSVQYNIYRGTSTSGIFYKLNNQPLSTNRYEDKSIAITPNVNYWYKISTIANFSDGTYSESLLSQPEMYQVKNENKWFVKMNERNMWILKNTGVLMDLYVRKTTGERCEHCWDENRGQAKDPTCKICFGTGFVGGYEPMHQLYVRQKPAPQQLDMTTQGYMISANPGLWTISSVQIHNRDLLINPEGRIFSVTNSNISHAAGYYFHQELQSKEIDPMDVKYTIKRATLYPEF